MEARLVVKPTKNQTGLSLNTGHAFDYLTWSQLIDLSEPQFHHPFNGDDKPTSLRLKFEHKEHMGGSVR